VRCGSSKERVLAAIRHEPVDYVPLSVLLWSSLWAHCSSVEEYLRCQLELGMDPVVPLPEPPRGRTRDVEVSIWREDAQPYPVLHKVYSTPAGDLETVAVLTPDWPHGNDVPLLSDFNIPRSRRFLVSGPDDLEPLSYLFRPPDADGLERFRLECQHRRAIADRFSLATVTSPVRLVDTVCWLCGPTGMAVGALDRPRFVEQLTRLVAEWQQGIAEIVLEQDPDIRVRAEWYASPFLSPALFSRLAAPWVRRDIEMAHATGAAYCYVGTANMMPFLPDLTELGVDVLYGIDPVEGDWNLAEAKTACGGRVALWGGINGYLQVVDAQEHQIRDAVAHALAVLAPGGGFILSPVDDIGLSGTDRDTDETWQPVMTNVAHMADAWRRLR
jgi:hypothetical protein